MLGRKLTIYIQSSDTMEKELLGAETLPAVSTARDDEGVAPVDPVCDRARRMD
jgi:hypothetical protein